MLYGLIKLSKEHLKTNTNEQNHNQFSKILIKNYKSFKKVNRLRKSEKQKLT